MEVYYKPSDIVWVKLGPFWWPGEVVDKSKVPEEVIETLKKEPVAFVKFFDDDEYFECVKISDHIYHYNCDRKNGFIKKGMDAFRANNPKLTTFPKDVSTAEVKTGGNANILSEPMFTPERKKNYGEIYGSSTPKKTKSGNKNCPNKSTPIITHRRFLGYDDYESHVLIQFPGKDKEFDGQEQADSISTEPFATFTCPICQFVTDKLSILTVHTQGHVKDVVYIPGSHTKKTPKRKKKKTLSDDEGDGAKKPKIKKKYKKKAKDNQSSFADDERSRNDTSAVEKNLEGILPPSMEKKDVCNDIIADWDDESNQDNTDEMDTLVLESAIINEMNTSNEITLNEASITKDSVLDSTFEPTEGEKFHSTLLIEESDQTECLETSEKTSEDIKERDTNISCFDFDENEEDTRIPNATSGRKIPRVIPLTDKRKSLNFEDDVVEDEGEEIKKKILNESLQLAKVGEIQEKDEETDYLESTYKSLMESTSKIELPEIPNILKSEQNFHCAKTVKYPEKDHSAVSNSDDGRIVLERKVEKVEKIFKYSEITKRSPSIEKSNEESNEPKVLNEASVIVKQLCDEVSENVEEVLDICSIIGVKNDEISKGLKNDSLQQREAIDENKCEKKLADVEEPPSTIERSKRKLEPLTKCPKDSVESKQSSGKKTQHMETDSNIDIPRKRYKKSKVFSDADDSKNSEDSFNTDTSGGMKIEEKPTEQLNHPLKIDQLESENTIGIAAGNKNKFELKKEMASKKKVKKDKKPVLKRYIDESEIDKLLAKYSAEPLRDDEESDYCSELVREVLVDTSSSLQSKSSEDISKKSGEIEPSSKSPEDISQKSDEIEQSVSEIQIRSVEKTNLMISEEKTAIESEMQNSKPEQKSPTNAATHSSDPLKKEQTIGGSQFEITVKFTEMDSGKNSKSNELVVENQVDILDESRAVDLESEVCTEQIATEVEFKEETPQTEVAEVVFVKEKTSKRSSRRHTRSSEHQRDIPIINFESKANVDVNAFVENEVKDKVEECDSRLAAAVDTPQVSEICEKNLTVVEQIPANSSTSNSETNSSVIHEKKSRQSAKKGYRRSSKDHKKESVESEQKSDKRKLDSPITSRRSSRKDRRSSSRHEVNTAQAITEGKTEIEKVDNISKSDDSNGNEKEKLLKDPHQSDTFATGSKEDSSGSLKNTKKSEKNDKNEERHKTELLQNVEPNSSNQKESHKSTHKGSRSHKKSSRSSRDSKNSSKNDSVEDVTPAVDQIQETVMSHRSSRSKSHHTDQNLYEKDEQNSLTGTDFHTDDKRPSNSKSLNIKSSKDDRPLHSSDKLKEKPISISQKEDRKFSHTSKSKRRSSKYDNEPLESSMETDIPEKEHCKTDKKEIRQSYHRSKSDKSLSKGPDKSSHSRGENPETAHGSSSHRNYRRSRGHSEKHGSSSRIEKLNVANEKDMKTSSIQNYSSLKKEKKGAIECNFLSLETEKIGEKHRNYKKEKGSTDDYIEKKQIDSIIAESGKVDFEQIGQMPQNWSTKQDYEANLSIHQEQGTSLNINQMEKEVIVTKEISSDEKQIKSEAMASQESESDKCSGSSGKDGNEKMEAVAKLGDVQGKDNIFVENPNIKKNIADEKMAVVLSGTNESTTQDTSISSIDHNLSNLISSVVGADPNHEFDPIKKSKGSDKIFHPVFDSISSQISSCSNIKENSNVPSISEDPSVSELDEKVNCIPNDSGQPIVALKQEVSLNSRRNRKPSRWDQKERPNIILDKKSKVGRWDQGNEDNSGKQKSLISEVMEKLDITKSDISSNIPQSESNLNLKTEKLDEKISQNEPSIVSLQEAEQIELIFGSSPLPKPQDDNLFIEEENEELREIDNNDFVQKKDPKKIFMMKSLSESVSTFNETNNDQISTFECSAHASDDDLMESVESQVARITHYEEPQSQDSTEDKSKHNEEHSRKESSFDTPEKKTITKSIFDTPDDKVKVDSATSEGKLIVEKKIPRLSEVDLRAQTSDVTEEQVKQGKIAPKAKKNYLLIEKSKLEKIEKSPESLTDFPPHSQSSSAKSSNKRTNEVATKLTNPKKRFVKSFEDFELNKQKKKSVDVPSPAEDKITKDSSVTGLVGKSPIVFKLKKQFLSKISNIFDEESDDINSTIKPKTSSFVKSVSPISVKELNSPVMKAEDNSENDNIKCISNSETQVDDKKTPIIADDTSQFENFEVNLSESLSKESHKIVEPELEVLLKEDTKIGQEIEIQKSLENNSPENSNSHQVHFETDNTRSVEFNIDTNLSNIGKPEVFSGLTNLVDIPVSQSELMSKVEEETHVDDSNTEIITKNFPLENKKEELEFVPIDGNLTVVSEKELEEGQVEITASMSNKKTVNLMNFSMDFSDDSSDTAFEVLKKENIRSITESLDVAKSLEYEHEVVTEDVQKLEQTTESSSSELAPNVLHDEESLRSAIIAQLDLNFDHNTSVQKNTIENILETGLIKKNDMIESIPSNDSFPHVHESSTSTEKLTKITDANLTKELEKVESVTPVKRSERKAAQKPKLSTPPKNEPLVIYNTVKSSTITDTCDLEDHIPSQIVCTKNALINEEVMKVAGMGNELAKEGSLPKIEAPISKLLTRLTVDKTKEESPKALVTSIDSKKTEIDSRNLKIETSTAKNLIKPSIRGQNTTGQALVGATNTKSGNKAIILSEKIIRPARDAVIPKPQLKRSYEDIEDIKPYIISKNQKKEIKKGPEKLLTTTSKMAIASTAKSPASTPSKLSLTNPNKQTIGLPKFSGKAKILNQTIIRPAGEILQTKTVSSAEDNVDFDINSMPIFLSDELLTPESLENMPIVLGDNIPKTSSSDKLKLIVGKKETPNAAKILNNSVTVPSSLVHSPVLKTQVKKMSVPKILQTSAQSQRIIRHATSSKSGKLIFVPENSSKPIQMKKPNIVRRSLPISGVTANPQNVTSETTGHKIMIVTNQQGQQQRLLLTPAHQKMFGMQLPKAGKTMMKNAVALKTPVGKAQTTIPGNLTSTSKVQGVSTSKFIKAPVSSGQLLSPQLKLAPPRKVQKVYMPNQQTTKIHPQKTILIKNQQGQTVRKIQGADEALLDKQVAEQLEAIKVSSLKSQQRQQELIIKTSVSKPSAIVNRKSYSKRPELKHTLISQPKMTVQSTVNTAIPSKSSEQVIPSLTPIKVDKKPEETQSLLHEVKPIENKPLDRPLNQLVIQDNMGNQTTVTEGQILALPSETVDGQPQSYMLVTLDESGNLTPLNNEALMSLDPSLAGLTGGDLSNMVLQLDPGLTKDGGSHTAQLQAVAPIPNVQEKLKPEELEMSRIVQEVPPKPIEQVVQPVEQTTAQVQVTCNINGEPSQQIILTGDPLATQKFLDSLSEGNTDLASILANAEGSSFLIQADGQQILINTEPTDAQMLQANSIVAEQPDQGNPMFATHPIKNQDILAAALADTDVFQQEQISSQNKVMHSQLSPGQTLFPMNVGSVLETSLTLNSPIMTPLEVPSTNSKKILDAESDILTARVSKNVDLPITITDPNISQTVSHQQVLMASDLQTNLELTLPISETAMSVTSGMNSPSFVYSLPNLGVAEHTEINQKSFSSSMPLLTEDIEETPNFASANSKEGDKSTDSKLSAEVPIHAVLDSISDKRPSMIASDGTFTAPEDGLCTLGGEMCSSLSEPPPEMFDIPISNDGLNFLSSKSENDCRENLSTSVTLTPELLTDENSMEIPVQPQIVADLKDPPHTEDSNKKGCKLD